MNSYGSFHSLKRIHKRIKKHVPEEAELVSFRFPALFLFKYKNVKEFPRNIQMSLRWKYQYFWKENFEYAR